MRPRATAARPGQRSLALQAACGVLGPLAFTGAWVASTLRQEGYSVAAEHISGLAAPDARDPAIMVAGFLTLGACTVAFGSAVEAALGGRGRAGPLPWLFRAAGLATIAAGLLRRDRMLLAPPPGVTGQSWHNHGHDLASAAVYGALVAAPFLLAHRARRDPAWSDLRLPALITGLVTAALLALFWSKALAPWNGVIQRVAVTVPAAAQIALACLLLRRRSGTPAGGGG